MDQAKLDELMEDARIAHASGAAFASQRADAAFLEALLVSHADLRERAEKAERELAEARATTDDMLRCWEASAASARATVEALGSKR